MDLKETFFLGWRISKTTTSSMPSAKIWKVFAQDGKKKRLPTVTNCIQYSAEGSSQESKGRKIIKEH